MSEVSQSHARLLAFACLASCGLAARLHAQEPHSQKARVATPYLEALARVDQQPTVRSLASIAASLGNASRDVSGLASDLELNGELGPRLGDAGRLQGRVELAQSFALASLGDARAGATEARATAYAAERAALRVLRRIQVSNAWLATYGAQRGLVTAREESALARALAEQSARAFRLGEATLADVADTDAYAAEAQLAVLAAEGEWTETRLQLSAALSAAPGSLEAAGEPPQLSAPSAADIDSLRAHIARLPGPAAAERQRQAVAARARELDAQHAATLRVGVAIDHSDPDAWAPLAMVGVTLPWRGRSARERAELQAEAQLLEAQRSQSMIDVGADIERAVHEIEHLAQVLQQLDTQLLPAIERGVDTRTRLFSEGEIAAQELLVARRALLAQRFRRERARVQWLSALANFHELRAASAVERP